MSRMKLKIAAVATAIIATAGSVGMTASVAGVDAGKSETKNNGGWCC